MSRFSSFDWLNVSTSVADLCLGGNDAKVLYGFARAELFSIDSVVDQGASHKVDSS